jgi:hypothetical protein
MTLKERLKELQDTEDRLKDADYRLRAILYLPKGSHKKRDNLITEALFKVRGAYKTIMRQRIQAEQKMTAQKKKALFDGGKV